MEATHPSIPAIAPDQTDQLREYRSLCVQAVVGLVLGLAAPTALIRPLLIIVPLAAVLVSAIALARIRSSDGRLAGSPAGWIGLCLGLVFATAVPSLAFTRAAMLQRQAQPIALQWFGLLSEDAPHKAFQLTRSYQQRLPLDDNLWNFYRRNEPAAELLEEFVQVPVVRTLLALGDRAQVRFYQAGVTRQEGSRTDLEQLYAVTFADESGAKQSFLVRVLVTRDKRRDGMITWRVSDYSAAGAAEGL